MFIHLLMRMLHFYTLAIVTTVDHCCRTAFKFIWFAHTLNYILCGNVKWFFVCFALHCIKYRIVLHCIVFCGSVRCGAVRHGTMPFRIEQSVTLFFVQVLFFSWHLVMSLMLSLFLRFHWPSESLLTEIKYVCLLHFPCKIQWNEFIRMCLNSNAFSYFHTRDRLSFTHSHTHIYPYIRLAQYDIQRAIIVFIHNKMLFFALD